MITDEQVEHVGRGLYIYWDDVKERCREKYSSKVRKVLESMPPHPIERQAGEFVSVPREPTEEMMQAGYKEFGASMYSPTANRGWGESAIAIYKAMLAAAPAQPAQGDV